MAKITIDQLAEMVNKGFSDAKEDVGQIDATLGKMDARLENVESTVESLGSRMGNVESRLDHVDARLGRIEADIHEMRGTTVHRYEFEDALGRIKYLEGKHNIESGQ